MTRPGRLRLALLALVALHALTLSIQVLREDELSDNPLGLTVQRLESGRSESLAQIAGGRPLLVIFWTTWCEYCAEELERGADLAERLSSGSAPVEVLFVNVREHGATVGGYPGIESLTGMIGLDSTGDVARAFGVRGYPSRVLVGSRGEVLWFSEGLGESIEAEVFTRVGSRGGTVEE
jgi:thiol-disulfide isomerase/thioredoxin